jgi:hypothetical protein
VKQATAAGVTRWRRKLPSIRITGDLIRHDQLLSPHLYGTRQSRHHLDGAVFRKTDVQPDIAPEFGRVFMFISQRIRTAAPVVASALSLGRGTQPDMSGARLEVLAVVIAHFVSNHSAWRDDVHDYLSRASASYDAHEVDFVLDVFSGDDPHVSLWTTDHTGILRLTEEIDWDSAWKRDDSQFA